MVVYGFVWLCRAVYGCVWLCMAMYGYVDYVGLYVGLCTLLLLTNGEPLYVAYIIR